MEAAADDTFEPTQEPPFRQGAEGPAGEALRARDDLLHALDVQFDGHVYQCRGRCFERFSDALACARQAAGEAGAHEGVGPHHGWRDPRTPRRRP